MATANFQARLDRINKSHQGLAPAREKLPIRALRSQPIPRAAKSGGRKRFAIFDHSLAIAFGSVLGCIAAVVLAGLTSENSPWGPGTELNQTMFLPALGGLGLAPLLMLASVFVASKKPGFALFSLSYLSGMIVFLTL
ncbi:hypothetical protein KX928_13300 [Roseobacter sp. YSTF-M11]|uniref:Uncharacterized protein n=1 Tax=Roseobacter insulae TaxID=2859783 RepID=A0A9X1FVY0_9RHOB|nr:hypothetical protein [Roseobacter insulae]MBW4708759.1 hypothetical protein [Roseobacter insulae]